MSKRKRHRPNEATTESPENVAGRSDDHQQASGLTFIVKLEIIVVVALALRLLNVAQTGGVPSVVHLVGDAAGYFEWGRKIAGGQWFGTETFYQAPLYPYFLAVLMKFLGAGITAIRVAQAVLGSLAVLLVGLTARNLFSERVGIIAAAMMALYPAAIYYDGIIQKTSLAGVLLCGLIAACSFLPRHWKPWQAVAVGLLLGLLVLTRENAMLWLPILPVWMWLASKQESRGARLRTIACYTLGVASILLPVAARNASLGGEWSPTTFQMGPNFYIGNNLQADGIYRPLVPGRETPVYERADAQRLAEEAVGHKLTAREVSSYWMDRSLQEIRQDPARWLQLLVQKSFMVVNQFEVPDVESLFIYRQYSAPLKLASVWHFGVLCPLAVIGMAVTLRRRELWLYHVLIVSMVAAIVGFFLLGRYRFPLVPLLIPFAALGVEQVWVCLRSKQWSALKLPLVAALVFAVLCNLPIHDKAGLNATSVMNVGVAAGKAGEMQTCLRLLNQAVELAPEIGESHFNLARAWSLAGRPDKAIESYRNVLLIDPTLAPANFFLAQSLEQVGELDKAIYFYRRAAELEPGNREAIEAAQRLAGSVSAQ